MEKNENGFGVIEILLVIIIICLLGLVGWVFFSRQKDTKKNESTTTNSEQAKKTQESESTNQPSKEVAKTTIYPNVETNTGDNGTSKDLFFTVALPTGWSVQKVYEDYNIVKTVGNDRYLISSSIEHNGGPNSNRNLMEQRVAEGIEAVTSFKTRSGTSVSVLKTPTILFLASCKPTAENCYLQLNNKDLYIHLYRAIPGAQSVTDTNFPEEIINDFVSIAKSLSI